MGHGFGNLIKAYGIVTYRLSPYEQKPFANYFKEGLPNLVRRFRSKVFIVAPPFIIAYGIFKWGDAEFHHQQRKNPADFVNDV